MSQEMPNRLSSVFHHDSITPEVANNIICDLLTGTFDVVVEDS